MVGNRDSLSAMIGSLLETGKVRRRIFVHLLPLFLSIPRRINFKQMTFYGRHNEATYHNWFKSNLDVKSFNVAMVDEHGSGDHYVIFDPSYMPKSGKKTPQLDWYWSGCAGMVKRGLEIGGFAVADLTNHTAFHLEASLTPCAKALKEQGKTLIEYYVGLVLKQRDTIRHFGNLLVVDGYFGISTFVNPVAEGMGIHLISCLRANAVLHYLPDPAVKKRGRPRKKGEKVDWQNIDDTRLPLIHSDTEKRVRAGKVYVKALKRIVLLVATEFLREDGSMLCRKLFFATNLDAQPMRVLEQYRCRYQIEFLFRDAKQFTGLTQCQSTNQTKIENHVNLSLTTVSAAKAAHWLPIPMEERGPFSMADIKNYYYNLMLLERFSIALGLNPTDTKNNPKIKELLLSTSYESLAA
jgi:hypothetical protein